MSNRDGAREYLIVRTDDTCWGNVRLDGTRLTVAFVVGRFAAGDSINDLAKDYGVEPAAIEAMVHSVVRSCYGRRGLLLPIARRLEQFADRNHTGSNNHPSSDGALPVDGESRT